MRHKEALQLIVAMATGHRGSWTTLHSDRSDDVFDRLVFAMLLGAPHMSAQALLQYAVRTVDLVVRVERASQQTAEHPVPPRYLAGIYSVQGLQHDGTVAWVTLYQHSKGMVPESRQPDRADPGSSDARGLHPTRSAPSAENGGLPAARGSS